MPTVSVALSRASTRAMWRASWNGDDSLTRSNKKFLSCLSRFMTHGGRFEWSGIGVVIQQFGQGSGRTYTQRHVLRLLAWAVARQLVRHVRHPAPGRPAVYEAVIPGHPGYRRVKVRRRGLRPRRLMAAWHRETDPEQMPALGLQQPAQVPAPTRADEEHRYRSTGRSGA